jgi:hypothetical protein
MHRATMWVSVLAACGTKFALPMTADQAVQYNSGPALVAYLGQPDASAGICDLESTSTAHLHGVTADERRALVDGFKDGAISPTVWKKCVKTLERELPPEDRATLVDALLGAYGSLLDKDLETNPARVERMSTLHKLYLDRGVGVEAHPVAVAALLAEAKERIAKGKLGPIGTRFATELIETAELEHGSWRGRTIDGALLDELAAAGNEITLKRFSERLPSAELRDEARRRIVRIHVALSPFPEVQHGGPELETKILAEGHNAISIAEHPVTRAYFDEHHVVRRDVIVRQHVWQQNATLVGRDANQKVSVVPELPLRGALMVEVAGISRPITVCADGKELDPSPCVDVKDIAVEGKLVKLDARAVVHVVDNVWLADLLPIADRETFQIPVDVAGKPVASLAWYLRFERPENLVFSGGAGGTGPDLTVRVGDMRGSRTRFDVNYDGRDFLAIVEQPDLAAFRAGSQGGGGSSGSDGTDGSSGSSGSECGNGGNGGDGTNGGDGGDGGDGGNVTVQFACSYGACDALSTSLHAAIVSWGGSGGSGGSGRSPTTHTDGDNNTVVDDPGCSAGSSGSSGSSGMSGSDGRNGAPGRVTF